MKTNKEILGLLGLTGYLIFKMALLKIYGLEMEKLADQLAGKKKITKYYQARYQVLAKKILSKKKAYKTKSYSLFYYQYEEEDIYDKIIENLALKLLIIDKLLILSLLGLIYTASLFVFFLVLGLAALIPPLIDMDLDIKSRSYQLEIKNELPIVLTKFSLLTKASINIRKSFRIVAYSGDGIINYKMQEIIKDIENGMEERRAINKLNKMTNAMTMKKFTSAINQNIALGTKNFDRNLDLMKDESWNEKRALIRAKSQMASQKLLVPNVMMFIGIMVMVMVPMLATSIGG